MYVLIQLLAAFEINNWLLW